MKLDRTKWEPGPWDNEPDELNWVDPYTKLLCKIVRNIHGALCGYVALPDTHPDYGKGYDDLNEDIQVHGGLTFAGRGEQNNGEYMWLFGFDCAYYNDICPGLDALLKSLGSTMPRSPFEHSEYRTIEFVKTECAQLAAQLKRRERRKNSARPTTKPV